ncbi:hypothetical protein GOODEAATRI_011059 [Goodea atripinnis]|uniref:SH3 domain-containing YSC84-like protein 1 n=1 Tax=Goodea atripinnis TaxID=208336 RepID=A0ABV0PMS4_9TELE
MSSVNPIPSNLKSEAKKAAKILREFTQISNRTGPDKLIPGNEHPCCRSSLCQRSFGYMCVFCVSAHIIAKAEGLAIISVIKAGFMVTARGGSGIVIARLADRRKTSGLFGFCGYFSFEEHFSTSKQTSSSEQLCKNVSDLVIILNQRRAIEAFTKGGNLTLGGNCTVAVGPMGRFYGREIRASCILNGDVEPPSEFCDLYHILDEYTEAYTADWTNKNMRAKVLFQRVSSASSDGATGSLVVTATHPFTGQQPGDLSFVPGDRITVITKTDSQYDWWEGQLDDGRVGIFPANFVTY